MHCAFFLRVIFSVISAGARSELDRFSMKAELFREINGRFLLYEFGDPTFLVHLFEENTTLHDISKFEEFFVIQFSNIQIDHHYNLILGVPLEACRCSICLLFHYFHFYSNF